MRNASLAVVVLVCAACGGGSSSPASVNGNIGGQGMSAQDAISNIITVGTDSSAGILIINSGNMCARLSAGQQPRNAKAILIETGTRAGSTISPPTATGAYTVYSQANIVGKTGNVALVRYQATDVNCVTVSDIEATAGTVTLTRIDASGYSGTFDMTFSDTSHVTGSFTANKCTALTASIGGTCT